MVASKVWSVRRCSAALKEGASRSTWRISGGDLEYVQDLELLDSIAAAYHQLRTLVFIEEQSLIKQYTVGGAIYLGGLTEEERVLLPQVDLSLGTALHKLADRLAVLPSSEG
jgi:hypothetical protein